MSGRLFAVVSSAVLLSVLLVGCGAQRIRDNAQASLRDGDYERAVATLEQGAKDYPDSATVMAGLVQARTEALTRLTTEAAAARAAGKLEDAVRLLERAKAFDPGLKRVGPLLADVDIERRQTLALAEAQKLVAQSRPNAALKVITEALKDNARHPDLLGLRRKLELDLRQAQVQAAVKGLAENRPISLDFRDANLRTVLDVVSRNSGINFVLDKDIRQDARVTVYLKSAKVEEAIDLIVSTNQLAKKIVDERTILIYPNTPDKQREHQEQVVRVFYLANAEAKGAAAFLKAMLKLRDPFVDERANMLALRESPENILLAERLISLYDTSEPEVLLELEVLEVSSTRLTNLGIKFPDTFTLTPLAPDGQSGLTLGNITGLGRDRIGLSVAGLLVNLKRTVGDVNTLSSPRIRVKNKEKAKILIGDKVPLVTATVGTGGFVSDSVSYIDVGLKLDVEPVVYPDDEVAIRVGLEVSSLGNQVKTTSGTLAYQIGTRNASTYLRLRDGQTQLLAGLISREERTNASRVPGAGDLPVLGRLFSDQTDSANRTELVLAITPHVIRNLQQPDAAASELWVGTEASPRLRPVGGRADGGIVDAPAAGSGVAPQVSGAVVMPGTPEPASLVKPVVVPALKAPGEVKTGDTFDLAVRIESRTPMRGTPVQLGFPPDKLEVVDIKEGDFLKKNDMPTNFAHSIEAKEGRIRVGVQRAQNIGAKGEGELVVVRFKALAPGPAEVALLGLEPMGQDVPIERPMLPVTHVVQIK